VLISQATHRHQVLRAKWLLLNLGAQALDVDVATLCISDIVGSPTAVNELTASDYPSNVAQQVFTQVAFLLKHRDRVTVDGNDVALHVHTHAATFENLLFKFFFYFHCVSAAAQYSADTCNKFTRRIRLGDIVISAKFEANNFVDF